MLGSNSSPGLRQDLTGPTSPDYAGLIEAIAQRRDRECFALLFNGLAPKVKGFMMRKGLPPDRAEDIAVETFVKLWTRADTFNPAHGSAAAWIFRIARNTYIDTLRGERHPDDFLAMEAPPAPASPEDEFRSAERQRRVQSAMRELPRAHLEMIEMSFFHNRPHSEIATACNLPLGTVKSRLRLALRRLRTMLGEET